MWENERKTLNKIKIDFNVSELMIWNDDKNRIWINEIVNNFLICVGTLQLLTWFSAREKAKNNGERMSTSISCHTESLQLFWKWCYTIASSTATTPKPWIPMYALENRIIQFWKFREILLVEKCWHCGKSIPS